MRPRFHSAGGCRHQVLPLPANPSQCSCSPSGGREGQAGTTPCWIVLPHAHQLSFRHIRLTTHKAQSHRQKAAFWSLANFSIQLWGTTLHLVPTPTSATDLTHGKHNSPLLKLSEGLKLNWWTKVHETLKLQQKSAKIEGRRRTIRFNKKALSTLPCCNLF